MTAATLHQICEGRYVLGLGASTQALAEGFHDTPFEHPAAKLRDVVTKVRTLLAGQPAQLSHALAARPLRLGQPPAPDLPIWVAALGQHTIRVAAELGDGWIPALAARDHLPSWAGQLRQLREAAVPHARPLTVAAGPLTAVDENADTARGIAASCTAWYLSAMGEATPGPCPAKAMPRRSRPSSPPTPGQAHDAGPSPPAPRSCSTSLPPTEPAIRSANNSRNGTTPPTSSQFCCHLACPGTTSKRPSMPQHRAPGRKRAQEASPPSQPARPHPQETAGNEQHRQQQVGHPARCTPMTAGP